jgi:hypothetical protein
MFKVLNRVGNIVTVIRLEMQTYSNVPKRRFNYFELDNNNSVSNIAVIHLKKENRIFIYN